MGDARLLEQLNQLFDNKLTPIKAELGAVNKRLDLVAAQVAKVDDRLVNVERRLDSVESGLKTVRETQGEQSRQLDRIERTSVKREDRLEILEAKTAHLPTPPHG